MKRFLSLLLVLVLCASCTAQSQAQTYQKFTHRFWGTFDTMITLTGYTEDNETFRRFSSLAEAEMKRYHCIFDQYNPYDGINNLYAVNLHAGKGPTPAEPELIALLLLVRQWQAEYNGLTNPAMGSVLRLWHDARTDKTAPPAMTDLENMALHTDFSKVIIDEEAGTIAFEDPEISLDLGAVAKGYAAELVAKTLEEAGLTSFIVNAGGNVVCGPAPLDGRTEWSVAIEDLDGVSTKLIIGVSDVSVVTSGDYQRYYEYDGQRYHHLIDPATLYPAKHMRSVTVIHPDSGFADFLSTAAFLLPFEESFALIDSIPEAEALWTLNDETMYSTKGFSTFIR